ncbi:DUF1444 family protein [Spongiimicrobium salis]|uniref:DUF1444 family protein n=1 Tax=Spongiimicrobium salis TaxID=1667022 RepID=UPI00374DF930
MKNILFLGVLCISCNIFSQELMSEFKFSQYLREEVSKSNKKLKILVFDELVLGSKFNNASFLHNLKDDYPKYRSKPEHLKPIVEELISRIDSIYAPDPKYKIDSTRIVPLLKPKEFINTIVTNDGDEVVYEEFNKELIIVYVEDQNEGYLGYRFFSNTELKRIAYDKEKLRDISLENLKVMLSDFSEYILEQPNYRMYRTVGAEGGGKYLSSVLLLPDFLSQEKKRLKQNFVVGIPKENQIIIVSKKNRAGIREIRNIARMDYYLKKDQLLTNKLYLWNGSEFKKF